MKINKITSIICFIFTIIFAALFLLFDFLPDSVTSILSNIFTGFFVSLIIALVGYFYEKQKLISKTKDNLISLYINMNVLYKVTGNILKKIYKAVDLYTLRFNYITSVASLNVELINDMDLELFHSFYAKSAITKIYTELKEFKNKVYNMKNISGEIENLTHESDLLFKEIQIAQAAGQQTGQAILNNFHDNKNLLNVKTSKLHEYEASLKLKLDNIIGRFYESRKYKENWQDKKEALIKEADDLINKDVN